MVTTHWGTVGHSVGISMSGAPQDRPGTGPPTADARRVMLERSALLGLEFGSGAEFDDLRHEWRRLFSELLGTFFLVLVAAGGGGGQRGGGGAIAAPRRSSRRD